MKCRARTAEDVKKAYQQGIKDGREKWFCEGEDSGIKKSMMFFLNVGLLFLADKRGWNNQSLNQYMKYIMKYADMYAHGDVTDEEVKQILKDEYDIEVNVV